MYLPPTAKGEGGVREQKHIARRNDTQSKLNVLTQPVSVSCNCEPTASEFLDSMKELCTWTTLLQNSSEVRKDTSSGNVAQSPLSKEYQSSDGISREVGRSEYSALSPVANTWNVAKWEHFLLATIQISTSGNIKAVPPMWKSFNIRHYKRTEILQFVHLLVDRCV